MRTRKALLIGLGGWVVLCGAHLISRVGEDGLDVALAGGLVALLGAGAIVGGLRLRPSHARPATRSCPRCGRQVPVGELDCKHCGFDFRTIGQ